MAELIVEAEKISSTTYKAQPLWQEETIEIDGDIRNVFPLFEPLNEKLWVKGWNPQMIFPENGAVQEKMMFRTPPRFPGEPHYHWVLIRYEPLIHRVEYLVSTSDRMWFVNVRCKEQGTHTRATIRYTYFALNENGEELNIKAMAIMFTDKLKDWEHALNAYLAKRLK